MVLTYCTKRIGYINDAYIARHMLAFIDYNTHLGEDQLTKFDGTPVFVARFGKRTKQWYATRTSRITGNDSTPEFPFVGATGQRKHLGD